QSPSLVTFQTHSLQLPATELDLAKYEQPPPGGVWKGALRERPAEIEFLQVVVVGLKSFGSFYLLDDFIVIQAPPSLRDQRILHDRVHNAFLKFSLRKHLRILHVGKCYHTIQRNPIFWK